jgi:MFS family permease
LSLLADTKPLRTPDFRRLWLSGVVTVVGANLTIFAVPVQLYALTQNSAYVGLSGLSGLFALVPLVVFGLWGGAWGRRDGPPHPSDHRVVRVGIRLRAAVGSGRALTEQRVVGAVPAVGTAGLLRDQFRPPDRPPSRGCCPVPNCPLPTR